ncbi:MAG TPA: peptidylprolyl isomerase [Blastocatellia bacterium]|nr:peptidylprolyl isomerase [Blastocatellia bacterium]
MKKKAVVYLVGASSLAVLLALYFLAKGNGVAESPELSTPIESGSAKPALHEQVSSRFPLALPLPAKPEDTGKNSASPGVVATVNGIPITAKEVEEELNRLLMSPTAHGGMDARRKDDVRKSALDELIVRELAFQRAKAMRLTVDADEVAASIKTIRQRYNSEQRFQRALKIEGMTENEFQQRVERDLLLKKIHQVEIEDKAQVGEDEVRKYYEENKVKFLLPESIQLKHIVVRIGARKEPEAKKLIDTISEKLKKGEDFFDLAYKFSEDEYRVVGGDYGSVHLGQLDPELEAVAFAAAVNQLTGPFKTSRGWHIISLEKKQAERQLKYEDVKEKIKGGLQQKLRSKRRSEFVSELRALAQIQYLSRR